MLTLARTIPNLAERDVARDARETIYERHRESVFRWALRYSGGRVSEAEDLTHDVFIKAFDSLGSLEKLEDLGGWLYRVTANLALLRMRRDRIWLTRLSRLWGDPEPVVGPELSLSLRDDAARTLAKLAELSTKERVVVTMKLMDGKSQREICAVLGLSEGYVSKLLARALERLRSQSAEVPDGAP
jgi:RNA polymerase sigma factor (sigma-70 family)